mgnify:CR=1 FL=1
MLNIPILCYVSTAQRVKSLVEQIRHGKSNTTKSNPSRANPKTLTSTSTSAESKEKRSIKIKKMYVGWLHRSSVNDKFKQVKQLKDGGAVREIIYKADEELTPEYIKATAIKYFFPEQKSKYGTLEEMHVELGNYAQERFVEFSDTDGNICTFSKYLKTRGLYSSKFTLYLMSTCKEECCEIEVANKDIEMGKTLDNAKDSKVQPNNSPVFVIKTGAESASLKREQINENRLCIGYERETFSSYSEEVMCRSVSFNRKDCYDMVSFSNFEVLDMELKDFDPIDYGYKVCEIYKGEKCFLSTTCQSTFDESDSESSVQFPLSKCEMQNLIVHPPSEIWGYDNNELILGVAATCHKSSYAWYIWYHNDINIKGGNQNCCLVVTSPGSYKVEVRCGERKEISEPVHVDLVKEPCEQQDHSSIDSSSTLSSTNSTNLQDCEPNLPVVDKEDIKFILKDTIGSGSFVTVYKGKWAGTEVAIKQVKVRNAARLRSVVNQEVKVHSLARHPNIVQLMALSYTKTSNYLVSKLVNCRNLEDLLFSDDDTILSNCDKCSVAKQISQAVAYLHNLQSPIIHRDIKPANVIIAEHTHVTKLCDMGLSKLKSSQSVTMTTGTVTGTPAYMAPECLVYNKSGTAETRVVNKRRRPAISPAV